MAFLLIEPSRFDGIRRRGGFAKHSELSNAKRPLQSLFLQSTAPLSPPHPALVSDKGLYTLERATPLCREIKIEV